MVAERFHRTTTNPQIERLRGYLADWREWELRFRLDNGAPGSVPWARFMGARFAETEPTDAPTVNTEAMRIVDASIQELAGVMAGGREAIYWRYINQAVGATVFRAARLALPDGQPPSLETLDAMADAAELRLLPIARRRGLLL